MHFKLILVDEQVDLAFQIILEDFGSGERDAIGARLFEPAKCEVGNIPALRSVIADNQFRIGKGPDRAIGHVRQCAIFEIGCQCIA